MHRINSLISYIAASMHTTLPSFATMNERLKFLDNKFVTSLILVHKIAFNTLFTWHMERVCEQCLPTACTNAFLALS